MENDMQDLSRRWKEARADSKSSQPIAGLLEQANKKKLSSLSFHYGNIAVLVAVVAGLVLFFHFLFPFRETLSRIGVAVMIGSVVIRIVLEVISALRSKRIDLADSAIGTTTATIRFYAFRKIMHGPVTITLISLYTIGLFMLTPEFLVHVGKIIFLFDALYLVAAGVLIWKIRKSILQEMHDLKEIIALKKEMESQR